MLSEDRCVNANCGTCVVEGAENVLKLGSGDINKDLVDYTIGKYWARS
jgi:hypothetical protein